MQRHDDDDRDDFQRDANWLMLGLVGALTLACIIALFMTWGPTRAKADGVNKRPPATIKAPAPATTKVAQADTRSWTGMYIGGFGQHSVGEVDFGGPNNFSSSGNQAGGLVGASIQTGQLVLGGEVAYSWIFGDLNDLGIKNEMEVTGMAGFLLMPNVQPYLHLGWSQIDTSFAGKLDGWKMGPGVKLRMEGGWELDGRAGYGWYDVDDIAPGVDATVKYVRLGINKRFDVPKTWFGQ